jgi:hypothetical protein
MAYSSSILVHNVPSDTNHGLLIADNSLAQDHRSTFDMSKIPAAPDTVVRNSKTSSPAAVSKERAPAAMASSEVSISKMGRSVILLVLLAIAYLATRRRPNPRMQQDISELRNFPKKRLARREAHA